MINEVLPQLDQQFADVFRRIESARVNSAKQNEFVQLVAVSKKQSIEAMQAYINWAASRKIAAVFGENYVQEYKQKVTQLTGTFECHLIGPLQRNKAKEAVRLFDVIQSVHSAKLAEELDKEAAKQKKIQRIFLQINISQDTAKSGFSVADATEFLRDGINHFEHLQLEGLMTITREYENAEDARLDFRQFALLRSKFLSEPQLSKAFKEGKCALSMGMSQDFEVAINEGASMVRIGTLLFGQRKR